MYYYHSITTTLLLPHYYYYTITFVLYCIIYIIPTLYYYTTTPSQVIRTKGEDKARGFGFVSFLDPMDCAKAIREQNGKYLGAR